MGSNANGECVDEIGECSSDGCKLKNQISLETSTSHRGLLRQEKSSKGFLKSLSHMGTRIGFKKSDSFRQNLSSPFRQIVVDREKVSQSVPSSSSGRGFRERLNASFGQEITWEALKKMAGKWIRNPMNMALLVWVSVVAISGAILFMVMVGMLDHAIPKKTQRNAWFEVNNQILNALFTLMSLYQHPHRIYHLVMLCRWRTDDISKLRKIYCKNGTYKPHEWGHIMVVVLLLHLNCFGTYALCGLNLGYKRSERPALGVGISILIAFGSAVAALVYTMMSPLGKEYELEADPEAQEHTPIMDISKTSNLRVKSLEKKFSFSLRSNQKVVVETPSWKGGLFDLWDDIYLAYLSLFCSFCVFGWNMERLGFGNMYVHIVTFLLFCIAPFWVFNLAAINIDNENVRVALGLTGVVLCIFGLLYGGFWRIQIRKRYNLPASNFCCGIPAVTDCVQWLFCCWCSLAQEVRTGDFYDIVENKFFIKKNELEHPGMSPLPREGGSAQWEDSSPSRLGMTNSPSPGRFSRYASPESKLPMVEEEELSMSGNGIVLSPPVPSVIQRDDDRPRPST
ncbi:hypothetical protein ACHQM5_011349 [Ranunculus cassubicifolius]